MLVIPKIGSGVYVAPGAAICGNVTIADNCCIFFNTTIRADRTSISIGERTNIQDNCLLHSTPIYQIEVGKNVSIGHGAIVHGCRISDNVLIGMGAIIMNDVEIGENCIIGAGTLITQHKKIPPNSLVMGSPGVVIRPLNEEEIQKISRNAEHYFAMSREHMSGDFELAENTLMREENNA